MYILVDFRSSGAKLPPIMSKMEATYTDTAGGQTRFPQIVAGLKSPSDQNKEGSPDLPQEIYISIYLAACWLLYTATNVLQSIYF